MSHHISGPRAEAEPIADITDLYAFPSPEHPGRLVLVLNTLPFTPLSAAFSDGLIYRFRLRPLTANTQQDGAPFAAGGEEIVLDCVFSAPADRKRRGPPGARRHVRHTGGPDGLDQGERRARRPDPRGARIRRPAVGPVHHGCADHTQDHRHGKARVHRPGRHLPRRQERPEPGGRGRPRPATWRCRPVRRGRGDPDPRQPQRPHRAGRAARGAQPDAGAEAVRPGEPRPGDPRPLQHGRRVPPQPRLCRARTGPG